MTAGVSGMVTAGTNPRNIYPWILEEDEGGSREGEGLEGGGREADCPKGEALGAMALRAGASEGGDHEGHGSGSRGPRWPRCQVRVPRVSLSSHSTLLPFCAL